MKNTWRTKRERKEERGGNKKLQKIVRVLMINIH
jgi:hypothetical protein